MMNFNMNISGIPNMNKSIIIVCFVCLISFGVFAEDFQTQLSEQYNKKHEFKNETYLQIKKFIEDNPESQFLANLYYQLSELSIEIEVENPQKIIEYYEAVLTYDENFPEKDVVLYNIAFYNFLVEKEKRDQARIDNVNLAQNWPEELRLSELKLRKTINSYSTIISNFKESKYFVESQYRLGNIYLDIALDSRNPQEFYPKALEYYDMVVFSENDILKDYGLFQRGWTHFYSGEFEEALNDFNEILLKIDTNSDKLLKLYFEADAIENIAFSLIEYDGAQYDQASLAAEKALEIFKNYFNSDYAREIILKSVELELLYAAPMRAIDFYNVLIKLYPDYVDSPAYIDSITAIYRNSSFELRGELSASEEIVIENNRLISDYNYDSSWYQNNDSSKDVYISGIIRNAYNIIEPRYYNNFVREKTEENYLLYCDLVENYSKFPQYNDEEGIVKLKSLYFNKAEISKSLAQYSNNPSHYLIAVKDMKYYNEAYPDNETAFRYQEEIFYSIEKIYEILQDTVKVAPYRDAIHEVIISEEDLNQMYIAESNIFENSLKDPSISFENKEKRLIQIIESRAELEYLHYDNDLAEADYLEMLEYQLEPEKHSRVYSRLAEISFIKKDFLKEEMYYRYAADVAPAELKEDYTNNYLIAIQSHAELLYSQSDYDSAAVEYLRINSEIEKIEAGSGTAYRLKAIDAYEQGLYYQKAIDQYLEIAESKQQKGEVFAACVGAWTISDSTLNDWIQSEYIRQYFINRFPLSNEAYKLRLQNIKMYESDVFADTLAAGNMYLKLHNDSESIDLGGEDPAKLYLKAIKIFNDFDQEDLVIENMLRFEKIYPQHPMSIEFLKSVALIYSENEEEQKLEDIAKYIYQKNPQIDLLSEIAIGKFRKIKTNIDTHFENKEYSQMDAKISEFQVLEREYKNDGLNLPLESIYEIFDYYQAYQRYYQRYDNELSSIRSEFITKTPDQLIRVNEATEWKKHIINNRRINKVMDQCEEIRASVIQLIKDGLTYDLSTENKTQALYLVAQCYEHGADVSEVQINKFTDVSRQLNNETLSDNPIQQKQYIENIRGQGKKMAFAFTKKAMEIYNYIITSFYDDKDYYDMWTDLSYQKLVDSGLRNQKIYEDILLDTLWMINEEPINEKSLGWIDSLLVGENSSQVAILRRNFTTDIKPDFIILNIFSNGEISNIKLNDETIALDESKKDNQHNLNQNTIRITKLVTRGDNSIVITMERDPEDSLLIYSAQMTLQYNEKELLYYRSTEEKVILTDLHWFSSTGELGDNPSPDSTWIFAGKSNFRFFKNQIYNMERTEATGIWYPLIDTTSAQTSYFAKSFIIDTDVTEAQLSFIGQKTTSIWLNGILIVNNQEIVLDKSLNKAESLLIPLTQLMKGENLLIVRVEGEEKHKGFIAELKYRQLKTDIIEHKEPIGLEGENSGE